MNIANIFNKKIEEITFCVVDVETTGMLAEFNRIMDIGLVKVQNGEIIEKWETLINPKQDIPYWITEFTRIRNNDVINESPFERYAEKIWEKLKDTVFVAHNAPFDYSFIYQEFKRVGQEFYAPKICTVQLARKLINDLEHANLDLLSDYYGINISARHRALPDAEATAIILIELIKQAQKNHNAYTFGDLERLQRLKILKAPIPQLPLICE